MIDPAAPSVTLSAMHFPDLSLYDAIARGEPRFEIDFYSGEELGERIESGAVKAWLAYDGWDFIGWCAQRLELNA